MPECLSLQFGSDEFATIRMVNGQNRFRLNTIQEWHKVLDQVVHNTETKALLITGEGRFFSNGIDLDWASAQKGNGGRIFLEQLHKLLKRVLILPIPTVALINGHAFGGGAFLALACDYRVMRPDKGWLNWPETALGLPFGETLLNLARAKIPPGTAQREALLFAKRLTGEHAKRLNLVDAVVEESKMADAGKELVKQALGKSGLGRDILGIMKKDIYGKEVDMSKL